MTHATSEPRRMENVLTRPQVPRHLRVSHMMEGQPRHRECALSEVYITEGEACAWQAHGPTYTACDARLQR